jgi:hypothetical protein
VTLGWNVDPVARKAIADLDISARKGTQLAEWLARMSPGKTQFAGFLLPDAALAASMTRALSDANVAAAKSKLAKARQSTLQALQMVAAVSGEDPAEAKWLGQLAGEVFDVLDATAAAKKSDCAMSLLFGPHAATFIGGAGVADGAKLGHVIEHVAKKVRQAQPDIKVNVETYGKVRLHTFLLPVSGARPEQVAQVTALVGDRLELVVGTADDRVMAAVGRNALKTLKQAIDRSKTATGDEAPPMSITLAATPALRLIAAYGGIIDVPPLVQAVAGVLGDTLKKVGGKDHLTITAKSIPRGIRYRLEIDEGLLKAVLTAPSVRGLAAPEN